MSMYDLINGHQVQCFKNNLRDYKDGDILPLATKSYSYEDNMIIIDTLNPVKKPFEKMVHIIKDSKVEGSYQIADMNQCKCEGILAYYTDTGKRINVNSYEDIVKFLYEEYKLQLDVDFVNVYYKDNESVYASIEALEAEFYTKWYKR
ncbi:MAG: hypothetical protein IJ086_11590 [Clostridium sp.]|nr:hypothetical protein [Clostridium sp.]